MEMARNEKIYGDDVHVDRSVRVLYGNEISEWVLENYIFLWSDHAPFLVSRCNLRNGQSGNIDGGRDNKP